MPVAVQIILVLGAIGGLIFTIGKALSSVQKEDIAHLENKLSADINAVKADVKEVKTDLKADVSAVKADVKEVKTDLKADVSAVKADVKEINAKFDRYLFRKLEQTDDSSQSK